MTKRKLKRMPDMAFCVSEEDRELFLNAFFQGSVSSSTKYENKKETRPKYRSATPSTEEPLLTEDESEIFLAYLDNGLFHTGKDQVEQKPQKARPRNAEYDAKIDLHGDFSKDAEKRLFHFLTECEARGYREVLIIHGRGSGVLRKVVMDILSSHPLVYDFDVAKARLGGAGAVLARLSSRKRRRGK